jgi:hypothetical protein
MIPMVEPITKFTLEAPAGLIKITAQCANGRALSIKLENVPSFVAHLDAVVEVSIAVCMPSKLSCTLSVLSDALFSKEHENLSHA